MSRKKSQEEIIAGFEPMNGDRFDYKFVEYLGAHAKVCIVCKEHGTQFWQIPNDHKKGIIGCKHCEQRNREQTNLIKYGHINIAHGSKKEKIKSTNLEKHGCEYTFGSDEIKKKIRSTNLERHGVENPQQSEEIHNKTKATNLERYGHENIAQGAKKEKINTIKLCKYGKISPPIGSNKRSYSKSACGWLDSIMESNGINIQHALNGEEYTIIGTGLSADGYCAETNTVYEYHGSIFHGNPRKYQPDDQPHPFNDKTAEELYQLTKAREQKIIELGYNLVVMWDDNVSYSYYH